MTAVNLCASCQEPIDKDQALCEACMGGMVTKVMDIYDGKRRLAPSKRRRMRMRERA